MRKKKNQNAYRCEKNLFMGIYYLLTESKEFLIEEKNVIERMQN